MSDQDAAGAQPDHEPHTTGQEVEAKFEVPDRATFARLQAAPQLGGFAVRDLRPREILDRYLDTSDLRFYRRRWVCRIRERGGKRVATLKSLDSQGAGAVYQRQEYEVAVAQDAPASWPASEARRL